MSRNYEPRYGRNYMKPIYTGGICIPNSPEEPFEDTLIANGDYGPVSGHYNSVFIHVSVPFDKPDLYMVKDLFSTDKLLSTFTKISSGTGTISFTAC